MPEQPHATHFLQTDSIPLLLPSCSLSDSSSQPRAPSSPVLTARVSSTLSASAPSFVPTHALCQGTSTPALLQARVPTVLSASVAPFVPIADPPDPLDSARIGPCLRASQFFPSPRVVTYNVGSLSEDAKSSDLKDRRDRVAENIQAIARSADVIFLQETRAKKAREGFRDDGTLFPDFVVFANPNLGCTNSGGTAIYVRATYLEKFFQVRPNMHKVVAVGHIQVLSLLPLRNMPPLLLVNVYLPSGNSSVVRARRVSMLDALVQCRRHPPRYTIAMGDWNLTESSSDSVGKGSDHFASTGPQRKALRAFLDHYNLREIYQPLHTKFEQNGSSRLDRCYASHQASDFVLLSPRVSFPPHPHQVLSKTAVSNHVPVLLSWADPSLEKHSRFRIPDWLATLPCFLDKVKSNYANSTKPTHPYLA